MTTNRKPFLIAGALAACGVLGFIAARVAVPLLSPPPQNLGVREGQLAPCPDTPNCVSSQAEAAIHNLPPIAYTSTTAQARAILLELIAGLPRTRLVASTPDYIYIETRTPGFGFIDDTEFYFDEQAKLIQVRAAARLGMEDFEVNRRRVEAISRAFYAAAQ